MAAVTICSDFGAQENKVCHCFHYLPIYLPWSDGTGCHDLSLLNVEFSASFSLSSFTFIKSLFSSSSLSAIRVVSSAYLRLLIFLPAILIPSCDSSTLAFHIMYSAYKLNKLGDNIQPWRTPFPDSEAVCCPMSGSNCCFLTCIQSPQEAGKVFWYSHLFKNLPQFVVIHTVKGWSRSRWSRSISGILLLFLWCNGCWGNLISGSSAFSKSSLHIWKFSVHVLLKPSLEDFELACEMSAIVQ